MSKRERPKTGMLRSGKQIVNLVAMVGAKWSKERLYVLFAGQQFLDITGPDAEVMWAALSRVSIDAHEFGLADLGEFRTVGEGEADRD